MSGAHAAGYLLSPHSGGSIKVVYHCIPGAHAPGYLLASHSGGSIKQRIVSEVPKTAFVNAALFVRHFRCKRLLYRIASEEGSGQAATDHFPLDLPPKMPYT